MNKRIPSLHGTILLGAAFLLLTGCSATSPHVSYYSLLGTEVPPAATERHEQLVLSVGPVVIPEVLKQSQIVTGGEAGRFDASEVNRWTGDLDREIARAIAEQLSARLGTQRVVVFPWDQDLKANRRIMLDVVAMAGTPGKDALLAVRWAVVDPEGKVPAVIRRSDLRETPAGPGYPAWVAAQQRNLARLGEEIAGTLKGTPQ